MKKLFLVDAYALIFKYYYAFWAVRCVTARG